MVLGLRPLASFPPSYGGAGWIVSFSVTSLPSPSRSVSVPLRLRLQLHLAPAPQGIQRVEHESQVNVIGPVFPEGIPNVVPLLGQLIL